MTLIALEPIRHDGDRYKPGDTFELPESAAQPLIDAGVARAADNAPVAKKGGKK